MPVTVTRLEPRIAYQVWEGQLTYDEVEQARDEGVAHFRTLNEVPAVIVLDVNQAVIPPDLRRIGIIMRDSQPTMIQMVLIETRPTTRIMGNLLVNLFRQNIKFAPSLEEALIIARKIRDDYLAQHSPQD